MALQPGQALTPKRRMERQVHFAQAMAECARVLLESPTEEHDREDIVTRALEPLRVAASACRVYLFENYVDAEFGFSSGMRAESCAEGVEAHRFLNFSQCIPWSTVPERNRLGLAAGEAVGGPIEKTFDETPEIIDWLRQSNVRSVLFLPVFTGNRWWGYIGYDDSEEPREWSEDEVFLLKAAAKMLGNTLHRWQVNEQLEEQGRFQRALAHCSQSLLSNPQSPTERMRLLESALAAILDATEASRAYYMRCFHDEELGRCVGIAAMVCIPGIPNRIPETAHRFPFSNMPQTMRSAFENRLPFGGPIDEIYADGELLRHRYMSQTPPILSAQFVPLYVDEVHWGFVVLDDVRVRRRWTENEIALLRTAGEIIGSAVQRWDSHEELEKLVLSRTAELSESRHQLEVLVDQLEDRLVARTRELAAVFDLSMLASQADSLPDLLQPAVAQIAQIADCDAICIHLFSSDAERLDLAAQAGLTQEQTDAAAEIVAETPTLLARTSRQGYAGRVSGARFLPPILRLADKMHYFGGQLQVRGRGVGLLSAWRTDDIPFGVDDIALLTAVSELLAIVVENHRLYRDAQSLAIVSERQRLARELHDSVTQSLYSQAIFARSGRYALEDNDTQKAVASLTQLEGEASAALKEMRLLLFQLRPLVLEELTLSQAVQRRIDEVEARLHIKATVYLPHEDAFDPAIRFDLYRIIMEALNNSLKHADATEVSVTTAVEEAEVVIRVQDNGVGFDPDSTVHGLGIGNMQARAEQVGARLHIQSRRDEGSVVKIALPFAVSTPMQDMPVPHSIAH